MAQAGAGMLAVSVAVIISGCAGQKQTQEVNRLKADIGLLDQRVSQLERASLTQSAPMEWPSDAAVQPPQTPVAVPIAPSTTIDTPSKTQIQQALKNAGFYQGPIDGKIGSQTREAIQNFQAANGLKVDGVVGKQTWEKLSLYLDQSAVGEPIAAPDTIK